MHSKCELAVKYLDTYFHKGDFVRVIFKGTHNADTAVITNFRLNPNPPYDIQFQLSNRPAYEYVSENDISYMEKD